MTVEVRLFASLAEKVGRDSLTYETAPGDRVSALWERLVAEYPVLEELGYRPLAACDCRYARWDRTVDGVREVAFLPPVSGG